MTANVPGRLLILRPQPGADRTAARAQSMGFATVVHPLFEVAPLAWQAPDPADFDALLLTSANTLRHGGPQLARFTHLPTYAVGAATAEAAADFAIAHIGSSDVAALVPVIAAAGHRHVLHLGGEDRRAFDPGPLKIEAIPVYTSRPTGNAPTISAGDIALLHSPRAAEQLNAILSDSDKAKIRLAAISPATAQAAGSGWQGVHIAVQSNDQALLALCVSLCQ